MASEPSTSPAAAMATKGLSAPEDPVNGVVEVVVEWCADDNDDGSGEDGVA